MFDVLMALGFNHALLIMHVAVMVAGMVFAVRINFMVLRSLLSNRTSSAVLDSAEQSARLVAWCVALLWLTGIGFVIFNILFSDQVLLDTMLYSKIAVVGLLSVNGLVIYKVVFPTLHKYSGRHVLANATKNETLLFAACGAISLVSWSFAVLVSFNTALNIASTAGSFLQQYFMALVFVVALACAAALKLRVRSRAASLLSYHGKAVANFR